MFLKNILRFWGKNGWQISSGARMSMSSSRVAIIKTWNSKYRHARAIFESQTTVSERHSPNTLIELSPIELTAKVMLSGCILLAVIGALIGLFANEVYVVRHISLQFDPIWPIVTIRQ
jgi:hydroxyethylthiazole kinase-like sugar kinase family protein